MLTVASVFQSLATGTHRLLTEHPFAVLACLPGFIALYNQIVGTLRFHNTNAEIQRLIRRMPPKVADPGFVRETGKYRPRWWYMIFGVISITAVFSIVAALGGDGRLQSSDLGAATARLLTSGAQAGTARGTAGSAPAGRPELSISAASTQEGKASGRSAPVGPARVIDGRAGLVYAGYGAYIYTLLLVISRLNSSALTAKFLTVSAVRSAVALILGFTAAETNIFAGLSQNQSLFVLFFIGLFPSWAMDALRQKAREVFNPSTPGCDALPLCLIDGIDDGIADHLAEIGIWDIEHLATSDPFQLAAKTIYSLRRVIDWMDQAILIGYVRSHIVHFRACCLRGAIDYAAVYRDASGLEHVKELDEVEKRNLPDVKKRAEELIKSLAQKTNLTEQALYLIGRNVFEDAVVKFIWNVWEDLGEVDDSNDRDGKQKGARNASPPEAAKT